MGWVVWRDPPVSNLRRWVGGCGVRDGLILCVYLIYVPCHTRGKSKARNASAMGVRRALCLEQRQTRVSVIRQLLGGWDGWVGGWVGGWVNEGQTGV